MEDPLRSQSPWYANTTVLGAETKHKASVWCLIVLLLLPPWATEKWINHAASILSGEAGPVDSARMVIACSIVRDAKRIGPWNLQSRWYGWGNPKDSDRQAIMHALQGGCQQIPQYKFVGCPADLPVWKSHGLIKKSDIVDTYGEGLKVIAVRSSEAEVPGPPRPRCLGTSVPERLGDITYSFGCSLPCEVGTLATSKGHSTRPPQLSNPLVIAGNP